MTDAAQKLFEEAMKLSPEERERLAQQLLSSTAANETGDDFSDLSDDERQQMEESIHEGLADIEAGRTFDTAAVIAEIRSGA